MGFIHYQDEVWESREILEIALSDVLREPLDPR
jgi:hypothetical protein